MYSGPSQGHCIKLYGRIHSYTKGFYYFNNFRHHVYHKTEGGKKIELAEVGPRFEMKGMVAFNCFSFL